MIDFYERVREATFHLCEAIENDEGPCRIAYWESVVEERRKEAEREELAFAQAYHEEN